MARTESNPEANATSTFKELRAGQRRFLLHTDRDYDLDGFSGVRQLVRTARGEASNEDEALHVAGLHRYVRHPLYAGGYLCLWGGVNNELALATALWASIYLAIGTGFEERRLIRQYGSLYREYRARVPAQIPFTAGLQGQARRN